MKNSLILLIFSLLIVSCNSEADKSSGQSDAGATETTTSSETYPTPFFEIENYEDSDGNPKSTVNLNVSNKKIKIADVMACEKIEPADYEQYQIPKNAIEACGGWWAGAGDYFYLISNGDDNYTVMQGEMHEEKETNDYDYKMVINLSNKLIPKAEK